MATAAVLSVVARQILVSVVFQYFLWPEISRAQRNVSLLKITHFKLSFIVLIHMNPVNIRTNDLKSISEHTAGFTYSLHIRQVLHYILKWRAHVILIKLLKIEQPWLLQKQQLSHISQLAHFIENIYVIVAKVNTYYKNQERSKTLMTKNLQISF